MWSTVVYSDSSGGGNGGGSDGEVAGASRKLTRRWPGRLRSGKVSAGREPTTTAGTRPTPCRGSRQRGRKSRDNGGGFPGDSLVGEVS